MSLILRPEPPPSSPGPSAGWAGSPDRRRPFADDPDWGEGLLVRAGHRGSAAKPEPGLLEQRLIGPLHMIGQCPLRQLSLNLVIVGGGQDGHQGGPGRGRIRDPLGVPLHQFVGVHLLLGRELVGLVIAQQRGPRVLVAPRQARPVHAHDHGLEIRVERARPVPIGGLRGHRANPGVVLADRRGNVTLPAMAGDEYVGDAALNGLAQRLAEQAAILFPAFVAVAVEQHQVVVEIGFVDVTQRHRTSRSTQIKNSSCGPGLGFRFHPAFVWASPGATRVSASQWTA